jgi:type II secretory pathway component GspD/PulD (secretin)
MQSFALSKISVQEVVMKSLIKLILCSSLLLLPLVLTSCISDTTAQKKSPPSAASELGEPPVEQGQPVQPASLPVKYQTATYMVDKTEDISTTDESKLKVEAKITSTRGPQPLWDIMKRLAALKGMNISWSSDVDQNVLVDVNISANDDFFEAIDNLLRQVDYYHEMKGSTIVVKYKETRQFHIAMPFIKQTYKTTTGGDVLGGGGTTSGGGESTANVAGEISLATEGMAISNLRDGTPGGIEFNTWNSIENNLNAILNIWSTEAVDASASETSGQESSTKTDPNRATEVDKNKSGSEKIVSATFRKSKGGNNYFIDKPVGLITVTAPRPVLEKLDVYFKSLQKELYKQVSIEAKILEVQLDDSSSIGLDWNLLLRNLSVTTGQLSGSKTHSKNETKTANSSNTTSNTNTVTNTSDITDTTTNTRNRTNNFLLPDSLTGDDGTNNFIGTNTASNIISNVAGATATSGVSAATVIADGLTGSMSGAISLAAFTFDSFLNAVSAQGQTTILANPKLSVLNGQPSLITVGRNVTYINKVESDVAGDSGTVTLTAETARALSGVGLALTANILDDNKIILNLVPVTSELEEPIEYRAIGNGGQIGLPIINVREMSTTVRVNNGEMLVIGGLISSTESEDGTFVPGTSKIPFFKYLFGYEKKLAQKRELIILLKPRII